MCYRNNSAHSLCIECARMDSKIRIILVVAVVISAGAVGAFLLTNNGSQQSSDASVSLDDYKDCYALVFGNADGDTDIDTDDVTLINDIVSGSKSFNDYKLADANRDGKVTAEDANVAQSILDGKATSVKVIDYRGNVVDTPYPINDMFFFGQVNARTIINVLDLQNQIVGFATNATVYGAEIDKQLLDKIGQDYSGSDKKYENAGGTITRVSNGATDGDFTNLSKLDFQVAIIEDSGMSGYSSTESLNKFKEFGAVPLILNFDNVVYSLQTAATLGVLVKNSTAATQYISLMNTVTKNINDSISTLSDDEKSTCLSVVMSNSVSGTSSDYYAATQVAGGKQIADWSNSTKKFDPSNGDTWLYEKKYNADYIIHFKSQDFNVTDDAAKKTAKGYAEYFSETYSFKNNGYYLLNGVIPLPARLAYMAEIMYPSNISAGFGNTIFQSFIDSFSGQSLTASGFQLKWSVSSLLGYDAPTSITLSTENVELGYAAKTEVTMSTDGSVYYPSITVSDPAIASVSFTVNAENTGGTISIAAGTASGSTAITVKAGNASKTLNITVSDIAATAIELSTDSLSIGLTNATLTYTLTPSNASVDSFSLESSDGSVVAIGDGIITGLKAGNATITVKVGSVSDTCTVTVSDMAPESVTWSSGQTGSNDYKICRGSTSTSTYNYTLGFTVTPTYANTDDIKVVCSNDSIIRVDKWSLVDGVVTIDITRIDSSTKELVTITVTVGDYSNTANLRCNGWQPSE